MSKVRVALIGVSGGVFLIIAQPAAAQGCRAGNDRCVEITIGDPAPPTPEQIERAKREVAEAAARRARQEQAEAAWRQRLGDHRAAEAARLAAAQLEAERATGRQKAALDARNASMTPQQRAAMERCERIAANPNATATCR